MRTEIINKIKQKMELMKLQPSQLASELGMNESTLNKVLSGEGKCESWSLAGKLSVYFDIPRSQLYEGKPIVSQKKS